MKLTTEPKCVINNTSDLYKSPARVTSSHDFRSNLIIQVFLKAPTPQVTSLGFAAVKRSWKHVCRGAALAVSELGMSFSDWVLMIMHRNRHPVITHSANLSAGWKTIFESMCLTCIYLIWSMQKYKKPISITYLLLQQILKKKIQYLDRYVGACNKNRLFCSRKGRKGSRSHWLNCCPRKPKTLCRWTVKNWQL